ncbi:protein NDNF [Malaya genurostris]|uniref:protein NDNF n=1 Tax=Malaya genurostris TaxID=325434 RepID=UPI0026F38994|nr:protein NDNF [Malaya genurostris]
MLSMDYEFWKTTTKTMLNRFGVLHGAFLLLLMNSQTSLIISAKTFNKDRSGGVEAMSGLCPRSRVTPPEEIQQRAAIEEWSNAVPATILMEDEPVLMVANERRMRYVIRLTETHPLSIVVTPSCTPTSSAEILWTIVYNETAILKSNNALRQNTFQQSCAPRGLYHVWVDITDNDYCEAEISYNTRSLTDLWPLLNQTTLPPIKYHQHPRKRQLLVKWGKSKFDIHAMHYCLVISRDHPQRTLCQALGNSQLGSKCIASSMQILQRINIEEEKKVPQDAKTTIACTGVRTKQLIKGMKSNNTYYLDVFAIHTQRNNLSYLLGSTIVRVNRPRPTQLLEGKLFVGKLSAFGRLTLFSFKVPKRSPVNSTLKLLITPCGGTVNLEIYRLKRLFLKPITDIYYPRVINVGTAVPGERYLIQISEADEHFRTNRIQIAVTTKEEFANLPQLPSNTTVAEVTQLRSCHATTIAWYSTPDRRKIRYCTYIFKQYTKHQYYSDIKMPSYCELEIRNIDNNPQLQQMQCIFADQTNYTDIVPNSMTISNLAPAHYYMIFVTASLGNGRSIPYRSARIKTHPYCRENDTSLYQQQRLRGVSVIKNQQQLPHFRSNSSNMLKLVGSHKQKQITDRRNNRLRRDNK